MHGLDPCIQGQQVRESVWDRCLKSSDARNKQAISRADNARAHGLWSVPLGGLIA